MVEAKAGAGRDPTGSLRHRFAEPVVIAVSGRITLEF